MMLLLISLSLIPLVFSSPVQPERSPLNQAALGQYKRLKVTEDNIKILYFSKKYIEGQLIKHSNYREAVDNTDFDKTRRTMVLVHGWHSYNSSPFCEEVRKAYLAQEEDVNVFVIDWYDIAKDLYVVAYAAVFDIAPILSKLMRSLIENQQLDLNNTILVGHSLGAHIVGITGADLDGKVKTIVGLDPALPLFFEQQTSTRLDPTDAQFVQAVHSCQGFLGVNFNVGHADYYANDGREQPGCGMDIFGYCAHSRSYYYFSESIRTGKFIAHKCESFGKIKKGACQGHATSYMGQYNIDRTASGKYFFETNSESPYAKGL